MPEKLENPIHKLLEDARKRLVETGTRNRLIHVNRKNKRANVVNIVNERSDDVFNLLYAQKKSMSFMPLLEPKEEDEDDNGSPKLGLINADDEFDEARYTDRFLEVLMTPNALQKRLLRLFRDARTAESEQGVNILYLALGFLTWFEDENSSVAREAPLILLPVELKRNARTATYDLVIRDDDLSENISLRERLFSDFGVTLPAINDEADFAPTRYFSEVAEAISAQNRWFIDADGMQLGFFSFSKLLMLRDLDPKNWSGSGLEDHDLVRGVLHEGFESEPPMFADDDKLDTKLAPADIIQVVDADASQTKVIEEVRTGRNLVVQGPPGTGKSQTITNIIAAAAHDGKKVLFVAEKMAALTVVHERLVKAGLRDVCLELHSRNANKRALMGELARTLNCGQSIPGIPGEPARLTKVRDTLNTLSMLMHRKIDTTDETPFSLIGVMANFHGAGAPPPSIKVDGIEQFSKSVADQIAKTIRQYADICKKSGPYGAHPFRGIKELSLQPPDLVRLSTTAEALIQQTRSLTNRYCKIAKFLNVPDTASFKSNSLLCKFLTNLAAAPKLDRDLLASAFKLDLSARMIEALRAGRAWRDARDAAAENFADAAWNVEIASFRMALANGRGSFFTRLGPKYRNASKHLEGLLKSPLPKTADERLALADTLIEVQQLRSGLSDDEGFLKDALGVNWRGEKTGYRNLLDACQWRRSLLEIGIDFSSDAALDLSIRPEKAETAGKSLHELSAKIKASVEKLFEFLKLNLNEAFGSGDLDAIGLEEISEFLECLSAKSDRYNEWVEYSTLRARLIQAKLNSLTIILDEGKLAPEDAETEFYYARAEALWKRELTEVPALKKIANLDRHELVTNFQEAERQRFEDTTTLIRSNHLAQLPQGATGEMGVVRSEIGKKTRHKPIRQLMTAAAQAVQRIKPVFLMSPISVAQFLPPGKVEFDVLVIDEASQVRPEDALGSVARAKQIVVVGDQKQLPPSSFFDRLTSNTEDDEEDDDILQGAARATELESILSLCEARGLPQRMLEWHYRSRDPSLIAVSNAEFYEHNLVLPPSPLQNDPAYGLRFTRVAGVYERGGKRVNRIEAEAVVNRAAEHAQNNPNQSLGIVTFSSAQRDIITQLLEFERRRNATLDAFLREGKREDVFEKNIENVQGDERDIILVSIGYGPEQPGGPLPSMNFGPVNKDGGERRLNVLFTRSRLRCEIFASFDPGDIDLNRTTKNGPRVLKRYLEFAKSGILDERVATHRDADSPIEEDVADEIRKLGFEVDHQVGSSGFLIDLGVRHPDRPGKYILAVECDGATYHSALWARERDRLRQSVLEGLGWRFHRIWSTDWFYRRSGEIDRLRIALESAKVAANVEMGFAGANDGYEATVSLEIDSGREQPETITIDAPSIREFPAYQRFAEPINTPLDPHEVPISKLAELVVKIVEREGPIHRDEVARRIASCFGKERAGRRIMDVVYQALLAAKRSKEHDVANDADFWFTSTQLNDTPIRNRAGESGTVVKAEYIAPAEFRASLAVAIKDNVGGAPDELIRAAALMMGFKRVGPDIQAAFDAAIEPHLENNSLRSARTV